MKTNGNPQNFWWAQGKPNPRLGKRKPDSERKPLQTYDNYYRAYNKSPNGKEVRRLAQIRYRESLKAKYGTSFRKAQQLNREAIRGEHE